MAEVDSEIEYGQAPDDLWWVAWPRDMAHYCSAGRNQVVCGGVSVLELHKTILLRVLSSRHVASSIIRVPIPKNPEVLRSLSKLFYDVAEKVEKEQSLKNSK